jgi:branched-chain amino acid transport system permease protein
MKSRRALAIFVLFSIALLALGPLLNSEPYWMGVVIVCLYSSILAISWLLILTIGHISVAHAAFMGIGGISSALLVMEAGLSFWLALPLAGLITALIAVLLGIPILRVRGIYFLVITLAFGEVVRIIILKWKLLGGYMGLVNIPSPNPIGSIDFTSRVHYYYLIVFLLFITVLIIYRIYKSRIGRIFRSIGENEVLAESIGIDILKYKLLAFAIGCFFAGLTGSFVVHYLHYASADMFGVWQSLMTQIHAVVGGMGFFIGGPITGAFTLTFFPELLDMRWDISKSEPMIYAIFLILIIFFLRGGLMTLPQRISATVSNINRRVRKS